MRTPLVIELDEGDEKAFFEDVMIVGGHTAADIGVMKNTGGKGDQIVLVEDRAHDTDIIQMARQGPGIVGDKDIPGLVIVGAGTY